MSATTPHVGVRVFSDLSGTVASIPTETTHIGVCLPAPAADASIEKHKPIVINTDDSDKIALLGAGVAKDTFTQIASEGIIADVVFSRADDDLDLDTQIGMVAGDAALKTGAWALLNSKSETGLDVHGIIAPGYTSKRVGGVANAAAVALSSVATRLIDCMAIVDTPETSREDARDYALDFATERNVIAMYPQAIVLIDGSNVTRPLSPHVAAAMIRRDQEVGRPTKAFWNRSLRGILGLSQEVSYVDGQTDHDANFLNFNGVGTVIERRLLWAPFTTATDPTTVGYRSIKRIRTRRNIEKRFIRALRQYNSENIGGHLVSLIYQAISGACEEHKAFGDIIDYELTFPRELNTSTFLRDGGLRLKLRFEETPDLVDLQLYTEPQPEAFDLLKDNIEAAIEALGVRDAVAA